MDPPVNHPAKVTFDLTVLFKANWTSSIEILESAGLGSEPNDICGNDFEPESGDHGDLGNFLRVSIG